MILRRVIEHVREQNWTAVGLDFVIVVVGVFIGIQVSNWNDARVLRGEERVYLDRLHRDLTRSVDVSASSQRFDRSQAQLEAAILEHVSTCEWTDKARTDLVTGAYLVGKFSPISLRRGVVDEMLSSGKLSVIRNDDIRFALADLLGKVDGDQGILDQMVIRAAPHVAYIEERIVFRFTLSDDIVTLADVVVPPDRAQVNYDELCGDERYAAAISAIRNMTQQRVRNEAELRKRYLSLIHAIEAELGYSPAREEAEAA